MAFSITTRSTCPLRHLICLRKNFTNRWLCVHQDRLIPLDLDIMDDFTTQLMQRKSDKWEIKRSNRTLNNTQLQIKSILNDKLTSCKVYSQEINSMLQDALEIENRSSIDSTVEWCIKSNHVPEFSILLQVFSYYSHLANKKMILKLIGLCQVLDITILKQYSNFQHYLAEVTWIKGNINEAIMLFEEIYVNNVFLRRRIKNMLKHLVTDSVTNRSEAVLLSIIDFAKRLAENYKDFYILACIWRCCILSNWFSDQCIAINLFEQIEGLRKAVMNDLLYITIIALKSHRIEIVYNILELLIKSGNKAHYKNILVALFDYKIHQRDLQGCAEIAQWSFAQGIELPCFQQEKFVTLLVSHSSNISVDLNVKRKVQKLPDYNFKF
ncbi:hypothetical protein RN001_001865 [Aquatica leii]|uniref:Uncharacterized protein n=1 Tax=Aquatica leii TaxID=1421715 RepID=A0AAN7PGE6_9COLE|nr:hypothetical protein RN001_001865 [Aquatica leii]